MCVTGGARGAPGTVRVPLLAASMEHRCRQGNTDGASVLLAGPGRVAGEVTGAGAPRSAPARDVGRSRYLHR